MRLTRIEWENFRRLPDAFVDVRDHLVLVGPNDAGKSSLLRAIHLCIGMSATQLASAIQERDFSDTAAPMKLTATFGDLALEERIAFPDEIDLGPPEVLRISITADIDPSDPEALTVARGFPDSGRQRSPSRLQLETIGWAFVPATRSLIRELGSAGGSAVQSLLSNVDIGDDASAIAESMAHVRSALDESSALGTLRSNLAESLSATLPRTVSKEDLRLRSEGDVAGDLLRGVTITIADGGVEAPLAEQSDGIRAMSLLAVLGMSQKSAKIIGIDEPETHLHSTAQRTIGRILMEGSGQRCIATHSAALVSQMEPLDIVVFGADRRVRQLPEETLLSSAEEVTRHWSTRLLDPLTARRIIIVEGPADRILLQGLALASEINLDRQGAVFFELDGSGFFSTAYSFFGPAGFDVPIVGLLDEDAREDWASSIGVVADDLESSGYVVCWPDLEGLYVDALGTDRMLHLLEESGITERHIRRVCGIGEDAMISQAELAKFCRHKRRKVRSALAVANGLDADDVAQFAPLVRLIEESAQ
jgi:putative ATP-dependent endonuclease of OLD family